MASKLPGSYGIDAPYVPILTAVGAVACVAFAAMSGGSTRLIWSLFAVLLLLQVAIYLRTTMHGKFVLWERVLSGLGLRGDEQVLDVGCGRGMVLLEAARRLPEGHAVGIDLWRSRDQSGNDPQTTEANAREVGVADRIELHTGDMSELPLPDDAFDLVTANVAIQNIKDRELRRATIEEMMRVTALGGRIRIVDIQYASQYAADLTAAGARDVGVRRLGIDGWFGNPFYASRLVEATKPA